MFVAPRRHFVMLPRVSCFTYLLQGGACASRRAYIRVYGYYDATRAFTREIDARRADEE